jgi:hypothetical protein
MAGPAERILIDRELEQARQDLREAVTDVAHKVERAEERLNPKRLVERHPIAATCTAGALGFIMAGGDDGELLSVLAFGAFIAGLLSMAFRID